MNDPVIAFAPMEGVTDAPMREWIGGVADFNYGVTEFIRVSEMVLPRKIFTRDVPELYEQSHTRTGLPIQVQLLGGDPGRLAESARIAVDTGAMGIDLNFGCPAPTVNRHDGGATLLKYPERIEGIIAAVRSAVPANLPVSAKLRLGFDDPSVITDNARRAENGGASWITIHARTKVNGYIPPAFWALLRPVTAALKIPVLANGEIWSVADAIRCANESGTANVMLGRGGLANPYLAANVRHYARTGEIRETSPTPSEWLRFFGEFAAVCERFGVIDPHALKRLKQWMRYITHRDNREWFEATKRTESIADFLDRFEAVTAAPPIVTFAESPGL